MRRPSAVSDEELVAFAEGRLGTRATRRVAAHLREHPADADRVRAYLGQDARLHKVYDPVLGEPIPARLRCVVEAGAAARRPRAALVPACVLLAVALAGIAVGLGLDRIALPAFGDRLLVERAEGPGDGTMTRGPSDPSRFALTVLAARSAGRDAARDPSLAPVGTRTGTPVDAHAPGALDGAAPGLAPLGLRLVSTRVVRGDDYDFIQYVYSGALGARVDLYVAGPDAPRPAGAVDGRLRPAERGDVHLVEWSVGERSYVLVADHPVADLTTLAQRVRESLPGPAIAGAPSASPGSAAVQGASDLSPQAGAVP